MGKRIPDVHKRVYQDYSVTSEVMRSSDLARRRRGRKLISSAQGEAYNLDRMFTKLNRRYFDGNEYDTSLSTIRRNLRSRWVTENDPFKINQLGHPYQGSMYHGFARSAGESFAGSGNFGLQVVFPPVTGGV